MELFRLKEMLVSRTEGESSEELELVISQVMAWYIQKRVAQNMMRACGVNKLFKVSRHLYTLKILFHKKGFGLKLRQMLQILIISKANYVVNFPLSQLCEIPDTSY